MAITFKRVAGAVRQEGMLVPLEDGQPVPAEDADGGND